MDYDYSLIPPRCSECGAMPVNDETPKDMYKIGRASCRERVYVLV